MGTCRASSSASVESRDVQERVLADDRVVALEHVLIVGVPPVAFRRTGSRRRADGRGRSDPRPENRAASGLRSARSRSTAGTRWAARRFCRYNRAADPWVERTPRADPTPAAARPARWALAGSADERPAHFPQACCRVADQRLAIPLLSPRGVANPRKAIRLHGIEADGLDACRIRAGNCGHDPIVGHLWSNRLSISSYAETTGQETTRQATTAGRIEPHDKFPSPGMLRHTKPSFPSDRLRTIRSPLTGDSAMNPPLGNL